MTLEDLGNLGDFIGGIAVIATLIYVAVQIRQNTRQLRQSARDSRSAAFHAAASSTANAVARIADSDEMARIFDSGLGGHALSGSEESRFDALLSLFFNAYEQLYYLQREAVVEPELWEARSHVMLWYLKQPGGLAFWRRRRNVFSKSFREYIDARIPEQAA